jgi:uncharacterized protein involved in outer membrane biogenesis
MLLGTVGLLLLLAIAGVIYLGAYLDRHKGLLEIGASQALGREVRIEGAVKLDWSMTPTIDLAGLRVANADWASGEYLLRAERAAVCFDIKALLRRHVEVTQVTVRNADVRLETAADGRHPWHWT